MQDAAHLATTQLSDGLATYLNVSATPAEENPAEQKAWYKKLKRPPRRIVLSVLALLAVLLTAGIVYSAAHATILFDGNGGTGSVEPIDTWKGSTFELPANAYSYTRHRFAGWSTSPDSIHPLRRGARQPATAPLPPTLPSGSRAYRLTATVLTLAA